jgi:hypothetical protein
MVFLGYAIFPLTNNYSLFFLLFYITGVIGVLIKFFIFIKNLLLTKNKILIFTSIIKSDSLIVSIFLALFFSFLYSSIWPSGQMDVWTSPSMDYYSWIFNAERLMGGINPNVLDLYFFMDYWLRDSFGTFLIIDLIATANLKTPLMAASAVSVTLLAWAGMAIYSLLKRTFSFKSWLSLFLTLGVVSGSLFNYVAIAGMFGHLITMMIFLVAMEQLCYYYKFKNYKITTIKRFFFPFFLIFLSYQGGFLLYSFFLIVFNILLHFLNIKNVSIINKFFKSICLGIYPVLLITIISGILAPGVFSHVIHRTLEVASQAAGWGLKFFSPWHFVGLPYYSQTSFERPSTFLVQPEDLLSYIPLITLTLICLVIIAIISKKNCQNNSLKNEYTNNSNDIFALTIFFLISFVIYFSFCIIFDHGYKVWKLAAYSLLPLSFIPMALFFTVLTCLSRKKYPIFLATSAIVFFLGYKFLSIPSLLEIPEKHYKILSINILFDSFKTIRAKLPKSAIIHSDFYFYDEKFITSIIFGTKSTRKTYILSSFMPIKPYIINFNLYKDFYILTYTKYTNMINALPPSIPSGTIFIFNYKDILIQGMAHFLDGPDAFSWQVDLYPIHASFLLPKDKIGQNLKLFVELKPEDEQASNCQKARLALISPNGLDWVERDIDHIWVTVPKELTSQGTVKAILTIPQNLRTATNPCRFNITRFEID